jgi:2-(1,2-epoxy-1,2-dihydrophenyl)acetyl-CoA isomerase
MGKLDYKIDNHVAWLVVNDPDSRNVLSVPVRGEMSELLLDLEMDPEVRCIVITGAGEHFVSGGDVKSFARKVKQNTKLQIRKEFIQRVHNLNRLMMTMRRMQTPIVARVQGAAAGAGMSVAMACDLVICSEDAFFTMAYRHIGATVDGAASYHLPKIVGMKKAMELALLGDRISAGEALKLGLVNCVVPADELDDEVSKLAAKIALGPSIAQGRIKHLLYQSMDKDFEQQIQAEAEYFAETAMSEDFAEGVTAFAEKRRPEFQGR